MVEVWKDIPEYEGFYQCSDMGNVKSLKRYVNTRWGKRVVHEKVLIKSKNSSGYLNVGLSKNNKPTTFTVHQLVAITFYLHSSCDSNLVVDHIDNDKSNNFKSNLQLITVRENSSKDKKGGASGYIGVSWNKPTNKWITTICINGKNKHLGLFSCEKEAAQVYQDKLKTIK